MKRPIIFWGILILILTSWLDLFNVNFKKYSNLVNSNNYTSLMCFGALIFVISMIADFSIEIMHSLYDIVARETLSQMAHTDELTGLANRRRCEELFDLFDEKHYNFAIIVFDVNNLKTVNDTFGHEAGDKLIKQFGTILQSFFQEVGVVARTGGDEFAVLIEQAEEVKLNQLFQDMNGRIDRKNENNHLWKVSAAQGVCFAGDANAKNARMAFKIADQRMYQRKNEMKDEK